MRVLVLVLACLACTGLGRRVHVTSQGPAYQAGASGRVGALDSKDSLDSLLLVRGGMSGYDDVRGRSWLDRLDNARGGYLRRGNSGLYGLRDRYVRAGRSWLDRLDNVRGGYLNSLSMMPSGSRAALRYSRSAKEIAADVSDGIGSGYGSVGSVYGTRRLRRGSVRQFLTAGDSSETAIVQGNSLKTWSFPSSLVDRVQIVLATDGRPLDADVQLWQGPDNTPCKIRVYSEDGMERPFSGVIATPDISGGDKTIAIRNVGQIEFPMSAYVSALDVDEPFNDLYDSSVIVQGGSLRTFNFDYPVENVEILLQTDGRPLNARIELLQGPNNNKQVIEVYADDGLERPFFAIIDTMGSGNVVRVVNTAPVEFPMTASVQPHDVGRSTSYTNPVMGGGGIFY